MQEQHKLKEYIHDIELELMNRLLDSIQHNIPYDFQQQIMFKTSSQLNNYKFNHIKEYFRKNSLKNIGFRKNKAKKDRNGSHNRKQYESKRPRFRSHDCIQIPHSILKPSSYQVIALPMYLKSEKKVHFSEKSLYSEKKLNSSKKSYENLIRSYQKVEEHKSKSHQSSLERKCRQNHHKNNEENRGKFEKQDVQKNTPNLLQFIELQ